MTLRKRLLLWYSGVFFLLACVLVGVIYLLVARAMHREFAHYLSEEYDEGRRIVAELFGDGEGLKSAVRIEVEGNKDFPLSYRLYDAEQGRDILVMAPKWRDILPPQPEPGPDAGHPASSRHRLREGEGDSIYFLTGWADREQFPQLVLQVGMSDQRVHRRLSAIGRYLLGVLVLGVGLSVIGGWLLAGRSLRPMDEVASSLERIQARDLSDRLAEHDVQDEIGRIVSSVNGMLERLEDSFHRMESFTADAAHELRTPLTTLKCQLDLATKHAADDPECRQALESAREEVAHLTTLVGNLLLLASLDAHEGTTQAKAVALDGLFDDIGEVFEVMASEKGVELTVDDSDGCCIVGDRTLLRRLFSNLLENAVRHTPQGGRVQVAVSHDVQTCAIAVSDTGPGIGPPDMEMIFERFYRTQTARSHDSQGVGLGLSICKRIVDLHGGDIRVQSRLGEGTTFTVTLPGCEPA